MTFTSTLWSDIESIYGAILNQPFIKELEEGSLSRERFVFYMKQDSLYLQDFSRALAIAGARAPNVPAMQSLYEFAAGVIVVERALHETDFRDFDVELDVERSPACFTYGEFLLSTASLASYAEAVAALLPCFWIYREVGASIIENARANIGSNPYARWIETYSGEDFDRSVQRAIALTDEAAEAASEAEREGMRRAFRRSAQLEWMFWDSSYRLEAWQPQ